MPIRVQRKRTAGWRMPENTVSVTRPSKWGNPFTIGMVIRDPQNDDYITTLKTREDVVNWYKKYLREYGKNEEIKKELKGKNLACFCRLDQMCHADILLEIANS